MAAESAKDIIVNTINAARLEAEVAPILCCSFEQSMDYIASTSITLDDLSFDLVELEQLTESATAKLSSVLSQLISNNTKLQNLVLSKDFTHVDSQFVVAGNEEQAALKLALFSRFLEIEPPGQVIDGDLVVQGTTSWIGSESTEKGPALCIASFANDHDESFRKVLTVYPWQMMFTTRGTDESESASEVGVGVGIGVGGNSGHNVHSFVIPIQLPSDLRGEVGSVRVLVFVDDVSNIPYSEEVEDFDASEDRFICALEVGN